MLSNPKQLLNFSTEPWWLFFTHFYRILFIYINPTSCSILLFCQGVSVSWTEANTITPDSQTSNDIVNQVYHAICHDGTPGQTRFAPKIAVWPVLLQLICQDARSTHFSDQDITMALWSAFEDTGITIFPEAMMRKIFSFSNATCIQAKAPIRQSLQRPSHARPEDLGLWDRGNGLAVRAQRSSGWRPWCWQLEAAGIPSLVTNSTEASLLYRHYRTFIQKLDGTHNADVLRELLKKKVYNRNNKNCSQTTRYGTVSLRL